MYIIYIQYIIYIYTLHIMQYSDYYTSLYVVSHHFPVSSHMHLNCCKVLWSPIGFFHASLIHTSVMVGISDRKVKRCWKIPWLKTSGFSFVIGPCYHGSWCLFLKLLPAGSISSSFYHGSMSQGKLILTPSSRTSPFVCISSVPDWRMMRTSLPKTRGMLMVMNRSLKQQSWRRCRSRAMRGKNEKVVGFCLSACLCFVRLCAVCSQHIPWAVWLSVAA